MRGPTALDIIKLALPCILLGMRLQSWHDGYAYSAFFAIAWALWALAAAYGMWEQGRGL